MIRAIVLAISLAAQTGAFGHDAPAATVSGVVIDAGSRVPIPFALVRIGDARPYSRFREAVAGEDGRFQFEKVTPGDYFVGASLPPFAPGYFGSEIPGAPDQPLTVAAGMSRTGLEIRLSPGAVISGRVTGADREPVPNATIMLWKNDGPVFGGSFTEGPVGPIATNSSGEFRRFGLPPGEYTVAVSANGSNVMLGSTDGPLAKYVTTYHPSSVTLREAQRVPVRAGEERNGIDIVQRLVRLQSLSGTLTMPSSVAFENVTVILRSRGGEYQQKSASPLQNGDFTLEELAPGDYWVTAESRDGSWFGATPVTIGDRKATGIAVTLEATSSVAGRVILDPTVAIRADSPRLRVSLTPVGDTPRTEPRFATTDSNGRFAVTGIIPGQHSAFASVMYPGGPDLVVVGFEIAGQPSRSNLVHVGLSSLADVVVRVGPKRRFP